MGRPTDLLVHPPDAPHWFAGTGAVLEWIGFPRWVVADPGTPLEDPHRVHLVRGGLERLREVPPEVPVLLEAVTADPVPLDGPLPLTLAESLDRALDPLVGLYTNLGNYNGMRGIQRPFTVPRPGSHPRAAARRRVPADALPPFPPDPDRHRIPERGEVLVRTGDGEPLAVREGRHLVLGLPLASLLARHLSAPRMDGDSYRFCEPVHHLACLLARLLGSIAPPGTIRVAPWPRDAPGAFALRHDHDRPADLAALVRRERALGVRPSIHLLADAPPPAEMVQAVLEHGGELGVHGRRLDAMAAERATVEALVGRSPVGHSAHGGRDADGWQGLLNLVAADRAGVDYTELLSEMHLWPHRVPVAGAGTVPGATLGPIVMPHHLSADATMREHDLDRLRPEIGRVLACRGLFTLMNHPDIHVEPMLAFVERWVPRHVPRMTLEEVARWWRATHVRGCLALEAEHDAASGALVLEGRASAAQVGLVLTTPMPTAADGWRLEARGVAAGVTRPGDDEPFGDRAAVLRCELLPASIEGFRVRVEPD